MSHRRRRLEQDRRNRRLRADRLLAEALEPRQVLSAAGVSPNLVSRLEGLGNFPAIDERSLPQVPAPNAAASTFQSIVSAAPMAARAATGTWTIMVYITGDDLNEYAAQDINEMESALTTLPGSVKIVTAWDQWRFGQAYGIDNYSTGGGSQPAWNTYGLSVLTADADMNSIASQFDLSRGEQNTGSGSTLEAFVKWGAQQAPADRYILQIWDHGGGLVGSNTDRESGSDTLEISEVVNVLERPGVPKFEILSYDNCLMGMVEIGFLIAPRLNGLYAASEDNIAGTGQDYRRAYQALATNPDAATAEQVATGMVTAFGAQYPPNVRGNDTFSATRKTGYAAFADAMRAFVAASDPLGAVELAAIKSVRDGIAGYDRSSGSAYRDVGTFMSRIAAQANLPAAFRDAATQVNAALGQLVAAKTADFYRSSGVSIYMPRDNREFPGTAITLSTYRQKFAEFCRATEWDRFLGWLQTGTHVPPTNPGPPPAGGLPTLAVGSVSATEGDAGTVAANVVVTLSAAATREVTFRYVLNAGSAAAGSDFVGGSGTARIPVGQSSATIPVRIVGDRVPESQESFAVTISGAVNATIQNASGTVTINDNDVRASGPTVGVAGGTAVEGHFGTPVLRFTVSLSQPSSRLASVAYSTIDGTARAGEDYFRTSGSVTFRPGETSKTIDVRMVGDRRVESDETLTVQLSKPVGLTLGTAAAVGTIVNDDSPASASPVTPPAGPPAGGGFQITVTFPDATVTASQRLVFQQAAVRWSQVVVGDLPDAVFQSRVIDDLEISATAPFIDGPFGTLGSAGPTQMRQTGTRLPFLGQMQFDSADMSRMERDGTLLGVILHEMGHVLGLGTLWQAKGLVQGLGTNNPIYVGARAVAEYSSIFGITATSVPVENTGGTGTAGGHWRESVFDGELMTGRAEAAGVAMPLSRITVGSLQDLGYTVDYARADAYSPPRGGGGAAPQPTAARATAFASAMRLTVPDSQLAWQFATLSIGADGTAIHARPLRSSGAVRSAAHAGFAVLGAR
jgi:hypothetical protein